MNRKMRLITPPSESSGSCLNENGGLKFFHIQIFFRIVLKMLSNFFCDR